jgi:hypothetical protein
MAPMKRLIIFSMLVGCGATQDSPDEASDTPREVVQPVAEEASKVEESPAARKLDAPLERRLYPQKFAATSHLQNDWNKFQENYLAIYLGDDNPKTSWTEGKDDVGLGEKVSVEHTPLEDATKLRLEIRNGYQKTPRLFTRNARAKEITLQLLPSGKTSKHTLTDAEGWQSVTAEQPAGPLKGYVIEFNSVYKGSHYEDLVVSDIQTYVTALTPDNPSFETSKQKRLMDWVDGRRMAAKTFKEAAKGSIPVAASYKEKRIAGSGADNDGDCYDDCLLPFKRAGKKWSDDKEVFAEFAAGHKDKFSGWKEVRISPADSRKIPQADHFMFPGSWAGDILIYEGDYPNITLPSTKLISYLSAKNLKRVYVENQPLTAAKVLAGEAPGCKKKGKDSHFFFTPKADGPLKTLLIAVCGRYEDREGYTNGSYWQLLSYADNGELAYLADFYSAYAYTWTKKDGAPFLKEVMRTSNSYAPDTRYTAK